MLLTDLREVKAILEIDNDDTSEDKTLTFYAEWASDWIEELLNRPLSYKSRTEYYNGTGTTQLLLRARPVETSGLTVNVDEAGLYGSAPNAFTGTDLVYGTDYCLDLTVVDDSGNSVSGILLRSNNLWPKPSARQVGWLSPFMVPSQGNVKVTYTAGYKPETLPSSLRHACALLVSRIRYMFPLGMELTHENYIDRGIGISTSQRNYILGPVLPLILRFRNWRWGRP